MDSEKRTSHQTIRTFIAVELPSSIQTRLSTTIQELKKVVLSGVRWMVPSNIHLTLKFLGSIPMSDVHLISQSVKTLADQVMPMDMLVGGVGAFPNLRRPRIIWVGVRPSKELIEFQSALDLELQDRGYPKEDRAFSPHLTLGRVIDSAPFSQIEMVARALTNFKGWESETVLVETICVFRSDLKPEGPIYTPLFVARVGKS